MSNKKNDVNLSFSKQDKKGRKADNAFYREVAEEEFTLAADLEEEPKEAKEELAELSEPIVEDIKEEPEAEVALGVQETPLETLPAPSKGKDTQEASQGVTPPRALVSMYDVTPEGYHISAQDMKMRRILVERPRLNRRLKGRK